MAATRLIPLHINKGKSIAQCLSERIAYSKNTDKTNNGQFISSYECDIKTVDEEFLLSKRQYEHITGRSHKHDVIAYQIRQSFKPDEVTPEIANKIGYELAMKFTKGKHAFIVATHTDKAHIHNHIIFNSTTLDCKRKFRDFKHSWQAIKKISDVLCVEKNLSIIEQKPYKERKKRIEYPKKQSLRDIVRQDIDTALNQNPKNINEFVNILEQSGYEIKKGKYISVRAKSQKRFIRLNSLGSGYVEDDLNEILSKKKILKSQNTSDKSNKKFNLLIDLQSAAIAKKGIGYQRWAKVFNLKQMAQVLTFLQENEIYDYDKLCAMSNNIVSEFNNLSVSIKEMEKELTDIAELKTHIINYLKTRDVYIEYRKNGYSKKFFEAHREELTLHKAAKAAFSKLDGKIPKIKELNQQYSDVLSEKKKTYALYREKREQMKQFQIAKKITDVMLDKDEKSKVKEQEKDKNER